MRNIHDYDNDQPARLPRRTNMVCRAAVGQHGRKPLGPNRTATSLQSGHGTDGISFWLRAPLTLVSSSLLALECSEPSIATSALFSTLNFNAITGRGLTRLLHCKEGLMFYTWVHNHGCIKEFITPIVSFEPYRSI